MRRLVLLALILAGCLQPFGERPGSSAPPCIEAAFDALPFAFDAFTWIIPLGNLNPPEHTTPTDHVYFEYVREDDSTRVAEVFSPGNLTVTRASRMMMWRDGALVNEDYQVDFEACGGVTGRFGHVSELSPRLNAAAEGRWEGCNKYGDPQRGVEYEMCSARMDEAFASNESMGTAGGKLSAALDLWTYDSSAPKLAYANPGRYRDEQLTIVCPVDYFTSPLQEMMRSRFGGRGMARTVEPLCGQAEQDAPGKAQGNWFVGDVEAETPDSWRNSVALVHDNVDASQGAFSMGGPMEPGVWLFTPTHEGFVDRDFDEVAPGAVYCYDVGGARFVLELLGAERLRLEKQNHDCASAIAFESPTTFER